MLKPARVIKASTLPDAALSAADVTALKGAAHLVKRAALDAQEEAARRLAQAEEECRRLLQAAEEHANEALAEAERRGFEHGLALATAKALRLAEEAARADARAESRVIDMARVLTEHLLGRSLALEPSLVGQLALVALREVRSVHALQFECRPADVEAIRAAFNAAGVTESAVQVVSNAQLESGDFRLRSSSGVLEASLGSRLDLLCRVLLEEPRV